MPDDSRKALGNLLSYAEELLRISEKVVADLSKDAVRVFHEYQIARLEGVSVGLSNEDWLRVARLRESPPPEPDAIFDGWLSGLGGLTDPPKLAEKLLVKADLDTASDLLAAELAEADDVMPQRGDAADSCSVDIILRAENMPEFVAAYRAYCTGPWQTWAEKERPRRQSILVYNQLFEAHQRMVATGDDAPIECVLGVGVARWEHPEGRIDAPVIEQMVELHLDEGDGTILVRPRQQPPRVSLRVFDERGVIAAGGVQRDAAARLAGISEDSDAGFSPFVRESFEPVLKMCQARLAGNSVYEGDSADVPAAERPLPRPDGILRVTDSWVLYVRQRSVDFRCDDIRRLKSEIENATDEGDLPLPAIQLASKPKSTRVADDFIDLENDGGSLPEAPITLGSGSSGSSGTGFSMGGSDRSASDARNLFLPLPYNDEQAEIIGKLEQKGGQQRSLESRQGLLHPRLGPPGRHGRPRHVAQAEAGCGGALDPFRQGEAPADPHVCRRVQNVGLTPLGQSGFSDQQLLRAMKTLALRGPNGWHAGCCCLFHARRNGRRGRASECPSESSARRPSASPPTS